MQKFTQNAFNLQFPRVLSAPSVIEESSTLNTQHTPSPQHPFFLMQDVKKTLFYWENFKNYRAIYYFIIIYKLSFYYIRRGKKKEIYILQNSYVLTETNEFHNKICRCHNKKK